MMRMCMYEKINATDSNQSKIDASLLDMVSMVKWYRLWDPIARKIIRSNDVIFYEESMHMQPTQKSKNRRVVFEEIIVHR